jgi:hypothetical protein
MESADFKTPYKRYALPKDNQFELVVRRTSGDALVGRATLSKIVDGVWYTAMFSARDDKFCASLAPDTGKTAPKALPAEGKSMLVAYNIGCDLPFGKALSVLLNRVVIWTDVPVMTQTKTLQFASGSYAYDAVLHDRGADTDENTPILAATNSGADFVGRFNSTGFYRMYIGRIASNTVAPVAHIERTADSSRPLPADVPLEDATSRARSLAEGAEIWFVENPALAGAIIGVSLCVCCTCLVAIVVLMRRRRRNQRTYDW